MRYYISGAMSGYTPTYYRKRFLDAEVYLKKRGHKVFNPSRWCCVLRYVPYRVALAIDILMMCFCDRVFMLEGWSTSSGARAERQFASSVGMVIEYEK